MTGGLTRASARAAARHPGTHTHSAIRSPEEERVGGTEPSKVTTRRRRRPEPLEADNRRPGETWWDAILRQRPSLRGER